MKKAILAFVVLALTSACVETGSRFVDDRTAVISGRGSGFSTPNQVQDKVMGEAARVTLAHGFTRFSILDSRDASGVSYYQPPATVSTNGAFNAQLHNSGAVSGTYSQETTVDAPAPIPIFKPGMDVMIRMYGDADAPPGSWSAMQFAPKAKSR